MIKNILNNKDKKTIKIIMDEINNNYNKLFNHYNRKYKLDELLKCIIIILKLGISYRNISLYTNINWNTIYKFYIKLINTDLIKNLYVRYKNNYISEMNTDIKYLYTDTTFICNKNGKQLIDYNPQVKKHKTTKISLIIDDFNNPIAVGVYKSTIHDSKIIKSQLDDLYKESPILFDNNKTLVGDSAYDSKSLEEKITNLKLGKLLRPKNIRNTKSKNINNYTLKNKVILKQRINIEHKISIFKQYNRLYKRNDRYISPFINFIYLTSLILLDKL